MKIVFAKLKEVLRSVLPITLIVLILHFTLTPLDGLQLMRFLIGAVLIIAGLTIFLFGVDLGITPIGNAIGATMAKTNKIGILVGAGLILGFFISIAEPDLHILAGQVAFVTSGVIMKWSIVAVVSLGIAVMLSLGLVRIVYNFPLYLVLIGMYALVFLIAPFTSREFLAVAFDASGATTGAMTVPFILALAIGVSIMKKDSKASEKDSFGLVGIVSIGPIISVMLMDIFSETGKITASLVQEETGATALIEPFIRKFPIIAGEVFLALFPILLIFFVLQRATFRLSRRNVWGILFGLSQTFIGLFLFLIGVNAGFMEVGRTVGYGIASLDNKAYVVIVGFILGFVTILAEPAVYVLTHQIEDVTSGYVKRKLVTVTLAIGVGFAIALSMLRIIVPGIQLWHYLLPGYFLALGLTFFSPKLFVGIAFDSGGVASGPMTATFILAFAQGVAAAIEGANVLADGFGMIAMVAMTPLIALQILGIVFKLKSKKGGLISDGK